MPSFLTLDSEWVRQVCDLVSRAGAYSTVRLVGRGTNVEALQMDERTLVFLGRGAHHYYVRTYVAG